MSVYKLFDDSTSMYVHSPYFLLRFVKSYPKIVVQDLVKDNFMSSTTTLWNVLYNQDPRLDCKKSAEKLVESCILSSDDNLTPIQNIEKYLGEFGWSSYRSDGARHHPWLRDPGACWSIICDEGMQ